MDLRVFQDIPESAEIEETSDRPDCQGNLAPERSAAVSQAHGVHLAFQDRLEKRVILDLQGFQASLDPWVSQVHQARWVFEALTAQREKRVHKVRPATMGSQESTEGLVQLERREIREYLDSMHHVLLGQMGYLCLIVLGNLWMARTTSGSAENGLHYQELSPGKVRKRGRQSLTEEASAPTLGTDSLPSISGAP